MREEDEVARPDGPGDPSADAAVAAIRERSDLEPEVALILGSGLAEAGALIDMRATFDRGSLPSFPEAGVPGHPGGVGLGTLGGVPVVAFTGRVHLYEGYGMGAATLTIRVAARLGARVAIITAAAGALARGLPPSTLVIVTDHINLMGADPLAGWRDQDGSPAFVDLSRVYDPELGEIVEGDSRALRIRVARGVYAAVSGPSYETPAEAESLRRAGGDVVGMSMVPEAVAAHALGMRVLGLATVTNTVGSPIDHTDVLRVGAEAAGAMARLLEGSLPRIQGLGGETPGEEYRWTVT